eukprot:2340225-Amphidinium_carterae.1
MIVDASSCAQGLFRFITDILIPVMDVYDDDQIRKESSMDVCRTLGIMSVVLDKFMLLVLGLSADAVQQENLVAIQQSRSSI